MPELPEVETTIRYLRPEMLDQVISKLTITNKGETTFNIPHPELEQALIGTKLTSLDRHGKWLLLTFTPSTSQLANYSTNQLILSHLRMSGRFKVENTVLDHPHNRFQIHLEDGKVINYIDQRRFGTFHLVDDFWSHPSLKNLGPDALSSDFNTNYLTTKLSNSKKPVYSTLLDQRVVAGLGNIYVNETLHAAGIHPLTHSNKITAAKAKEIVQHAKRILHMALEFKGTTLIDNLYQDPGGNTGTFAQMLQVYGKKNDPTIEVFKIGGRSVSVRKGSINHETAQHTKHFC